MRDKDDKFRPLYSVPGEIVRAFNEADIIARANARAMEEVLNRQRLQARLDSLLMSHWDPSLEDDDDSFR